MIKINQISPSKSYHLFENLKISPKKYPKTRTLRVTFAQIEFLVTKNSFVYFKFVQFECRILRGIAVLVFQHWCHSFSKFRFTSLDFKNIFGFLFFDAFCMTKLESYFLRFISWILNDEWSPVKRRALIASSLDDARSRGCCKIDAVRKFWGKWKMYARLWKFSLVGGKVGLSL